VHAFAVLGTILIKEKTKKRLMAKIVSESAATSTAIYAVVIVVILLAAGIAGIALYYKATPAKETTVLANLQSNSDFSTLVNALQVSGVSGTIAGTTPYTIFAPTNEAFANLPSGVLSTLLSNPTQLAAVLNYHIVAGKVNESSMFELTSLTTVQGSALPIGVAGTSLEVGGNASLTQAAIPCTNGVIHPINTVLVPPALVISTLGKMTILQTAETLGLTYLVNGLQTANLASTLSQPGNFTLFAPTNNAMSAFTCTNPYANCLADLMANQSALTSVLQNHLASGNFTTAQLVKLGSVTTQEGQILTVTSASGTVSVGIATITTSDIKCTNGYIDVINAVLVPPGY
jgi:transforming growth factor-beta-induced protein